MIERIPRWSADPLTNLRQELKFITDSRNARVTYHREQIRNINEWFDGQAVQLNRQITRLKREQLAQVVRIHVAPNLGSDEDNAHYLELLEKFR